MGGRGDYPWGGAFDPARLNCADAWAGRDLSDPGDLLEWLKSDELKEASTTAVTTYPGGQSRLGVWDGSGNVWEWMAEPYPPGSDSIALRGGSWYLNQRYARVSSRGSDFPGDFDLYVGFRLVVAPV
jgi:formylglycine-generating enzyme required for sulfatase activity